MTVIKVKHLSNDNLTKEVRESIVKSVDGQLVNLFTSIGNIESLLPLLPLEKCGVAAYSLLVSQTRLFKLITELTERIKK